MELRVGGDKGSPHPGATSFANDDVAVAECALF